MGSEQRRVENTAMSRYGYGVTDKVITALIQDILRVRAPDKLGLITRLPGQPLSEDEREAVREVLADELLEEGLGPDEEPNERGRLVESAIDWLGHQ